MIGILTLLGQIFGDVDSAVKSEKARVEAKERYENSGKKTDIYIDGYGRTFDGKSHVRVYTDFDPKTGHQFTRNLRTYNPERDITYEKNMRRIKEMFKLGFRVFPDPTNENPDPKYGARLFWEYDDSGKQIHKYVIGKIFDRFYYIDVEKCMCVRPTDGEKISTMKAYHWHKKNLPEFRYHGYNYKFEVDTFNKKLEKIKDEYLHNGNSFADFSFIVKKTSEVAVAPENILLLKEWEEVYHDWQTRI